MVRVRVRVSWASRVYLRGMSIHTATGEASRVYSISLIIMHTLVPLSDCTGY